MPIQVPSTRYLTAAQAAKQLGVTMPTLYAYVSRGLIRSENTPNPADKRARRYAADDVQRLLERNRLQHHPDKMPDSTLHWGMPVLDSALTCVEDGHVYYRGRDVITLSGQATFEEVASLFWANDLTANTRLFSAPPARWPTGLSTLARTWRDWLPIDRMMTALPIAARDDAAAADIRPAAVARTGARIVQLLTGTLIGSMNTSKSSTRPGRPRIAEQLQHAFAPQQPTVTALLDAALIVCVDHELNASSFTARCVAATSANPYAVVSAGLAALQGPKHGGASERVVSFLTSISDRTQARDAVVARLREGQIIPGFGHTLYPQGDPRGRLLMDLLPRYFPHSATVRTAQVVAEIVAEVLEEFPTIDFGIATLVTALGLPAGTALGLFALGRSVGWVGHAQEQYQTDRLIRPRARYVGPPPGQV